MITTSSGVKHEAVKVVGSGHSWNHVAVTPTRGHLINLSKYKKILSLDARGKQITFQAGLRLIHLNAFLDGHGLALHNLGHIGYQTFSGLQ